MAILDNHFDFANQQALTGTVDVVSTNVYDAGSAKKLFQGGGEPIKLGVQVTASGGTTPTIRARLVGADNAALTTNPVIIADTGVSAAIVAADLPIIHELTPAFQATAKQYYGVIFTQGGTTPTATVNAHLVRDAQSNLLR